MFNNIKHKNRGQLEIFGLAVIMIIIILGFFIMLSFKTGEKPKTIQKDFTYNQLPTNFINSLVNVQVDGCSARSIKDLSIDCSGPHRITCDSGISSCAKLNTSIRTILDRMLKVDNVKFKFYTENLQPNIEVVNLNCTGNDVEKQNGKIIIPTYPNPGAVILAIDICKQ